MPSKTHLQICMQRLDVKAGVIRDHLSQPSARPRKSEVISLLHLIEIAMAAYEEEETQKEKDQKNVNSNYYLGRVAPKSSDE